MKHQLNAITTVETFPDRSVIVVQEESTRSDVDMGRAAIIFTGDEFMDMVKRIAKAMEVAGIVGGKKLWTITCDVREDEGPLVDMVYCDRKPTWPEIIKIHDHLENFNPDEDSIQIEEYSDIPTIQ